MVVLSRERKAVTVGTGKVAEGGCEKRPGRCEKRPNFMSGACAWCACCGYLRKFEQGDNTISRGIVKETNVVQAVVWAEEHSQA